MKNATSVLASLAGDNILSEILETNFVLYIYECLLRCIFHPIYFTLKHFPYLSNFRGWIMDDTTQPFYPLSPLSVCLSVYSASGDSIQIAFTVSSYWSHWWKTTLAFCDWWHTVIRFSKTCLIVYITNRQNFLFIAKWPSLWLSNTQLILLRN